MFERELLYTHPEDNPEVKPWIKQIFTRSHLFKKSGSWSSKYQGNQEPLLMSQEPFHQIIAQNSVLDASYKL